jgi:hypothetical protein
MKTREEIFFDFYNNYLPNHTKYDSEVDKEIIFSRINRLKDFILGVKNIDIQFSNMIMENIYGSGFLHGLLIRIIYNEINSMSINDPVLKFSLVPPIKYPPSAYSYYIFNVCSFCLSQKENFRNIEFYEFLKRQGFSDYDIVKISLNPINHGERFIKKTVNEKIELTFKGDLFLKLLKDKNTNANTFGKEENFLELFLNVDSEDRQNAVFEFFIEFFPQGIEGVEEKYLVHQYYSQIGSINVVNCLKLLENDAEKYESIVIQILGKFKSNFLSKYAIIHALYLNLPSKYESQLDTISEEYLQIFFKAFDPNYSDNYYSEYNFYISSDKVGYCSENIINRLFEKKPKEAKGKLVELLTNSERITSRFLHFLSEKFNEDSMIYLEKALLKNSKNVDSNYFETWFRVIKDYNYNHLSDLIFDFCENYATKKDRIIGSETLASIKNERVEEYAKSLLSAKKSNSRITGALVLSFINSPESIKALKDTLDLEKSDDARDIIMEALAESQYSKQFSKSELQETIAFAEKRGKLNKFNEKWLVEAELAPVFWRDGGEALTSNEIRFLFYRIARAKGLNSDIEARQLINAIDKEKSIKFTKQLIKAFVDTGSDTKFKHYLTTAGQLGGNEILPTINNIFRQNLADKRIKMAEYTVEALGMIGTNKALRQVEVISRKLANKRPSVSQKAKLVLEAAATELSISPDDLSDRIIPDFEFEGLYKPFDVGGETYRAFINTDFSLCYFDEDNKMKKSLPKGISSEQKTELKEIEKELKEVVKGQKGRLEKYLLEERRWTSLDWMNYFLEHPIMFVYARKVVWAVFDKNEKLKGSFYCSDDTSLYDINDDEVELSEGDLVGLAHPLYLDQETLNKWKDKLYEMSLITLFPQMDRKVFLVQDSEKESNVSKLFYNTEIPKGADFVSSNVEKMGWYKSNSDGGSLELTKKQIPKGINANIYIEGVMAWYQEGNAKAIVYEVTFRGKNWNEKVLLKDLPPVFYSETMADIDYLINA